MPLRSSMPSTSLSSLHQDLLTGDEVGAGLADDLRRSSVIEYDASTRSTRPAGGRARGCRRPSPPTSPLDARRPRCRGLRRGSCPSRCRCRWGRRLRLQEPDAGLVVLHPDGDLASVCELLHPGAGLELGRGGLGSTSVEPPPSSLPASRRPASAPARTAAGVTHRVDFLLRFPARSPCASGIPGCVSA